MSPAWPKMMVRVPEMELAMVQTPWPWALIVKTPTSVGPLRSKLPTKGMLALGTPMVNVEGPWTA